MNISMQSIVVRKDVIAADLDGEIVMMDIESGNYYNLGRIGSIIWNMLDQPICVELLVQKLLEKFQVTRQLCEKETLDFLHVLKEEGLIIVE